PEAPELSINAGNSLHMLGDYSRALPDYAKAIDATDFHLRAIAQYDRGNTLFRLGRLEDARDAYRETLRLDPSDRDAKFNLELVQTLLDGRRPSQLRVPPTARTPGTRALSLCRRRALSRVEGRGRSRRRLRPRRRPICRA